MNSSNEVTWAVLGSLPFTEDLHQVTKMQSEELENENARLHGEFCAWPAFSLTHILLLVPVTARKSNLWGGCQVSQPVFCTLRCQ